MNRYEKYKKVDLPYLGEIPEGWETRRIGAIFDLRKEKNSPIKTNAILSLSAKYGVSLYSDRIEKGGNKPKEDLTAYNVCHKGDILVNCMNIVAGSVGISKYFGAISPVYYALKINSDNISKEYMEYLFRNYNFQRSLIGLGKGIQMSETDDGRLYTVRMRVSWDSLKIQKFLFPPFKEQKQIAKFLDWKISEIDKLIEIEKEKIKDINILRNSLVNKIVTHGIDEHVGYKDSHIDYIGEIPKHWETNKIISVCNIIRGNSTFKKDELLEGGQFIALQYGKTYKVEKIDETFNFYVNEEFYKITQVVNKGDIIFVSTSETIDDLGHTVFYDRDEIGLIGGEQILVKPFSNINSEYLFYLSKKISGKVKKNATGIKVYRFNTNDLKNIKIAIPPENEQKEIVKFLDNKMKIIDSLLQNINKTIKKLELLKQALISEVVTGKIDVRNIKVSNID